MLLSANTGQYQIQNFHFLDTIQRVIQHNKIESTYKNQPTKSNNKIFFHVVS